MSIWRDIYLSMPKGERFEFAKRTLSVPHVKIQQASDAFWNDGKDMTNPLSFGRVVPPWPVSWVEYTAPDSFEIDGELKIGLRLHVGAIVICDRITEKMHKALSAGPFKKSSSVGGFTMGCAFYVLEISTTDEPMAARTPYGIMTALSADGRVIVVNDKWMSSEDEIRLPMKYANSQEQQRGMSDLLRLLRDPILMAFGLAHCKNVRVEETTEPAPKCVRREGFPDAKVTYRTLAIGGPAKSARKRLEEDAEEASIQRALHICRGHFAEYGPEAPLFGKHTGQFWVPQHVRGTEKAGRVVKDYEVKKPTGEV